MDQRTSGTSTQFSGNTNDTHTIEKQVLLRAPRSRVWRAITEIREFCQWFGLAKADGAFAPGARLHMTATSELCGGDFDMFIEAMQAEHLFSYRWHPGARDPALDYEREPTTLVVFTLAEVSGGTLLTITESGFDRISLTRRARVLGENVGGWDGQVQNLERYVNQAS